VVVVPLKGVDSKEVDDDQALLLKKYTWMARAVVTE
jgi:hypothetical protein